MTDDAITLADVGFSYVKGRWIFRGYSAAIRKGSIFAILGPNGRGKTTLLRILLGSLKPTAGNLTISGKLAFVPQLFQVSFDYSALDMVLMGRAKHIGMFAQPSANDEAEAFAALDRFGMADQAKRPFHEFSGGQRQLVILARALVAQADILLLDEPTSALDLKNQEVVLDWMHRLTNEDGLTIAFTTHHPHHALAIADDALLMLGESQFAAGAAREVLTEANLESLYGVALKRLAYELDGRTIETLAPVYRQR